jgi:hypothetical protein
MHALARDASSDNGESYERGVRMAPVDDFDRFELHDVLRALSWQLYDVSKETLEISKRERAGGVLSQADCSRRTYNRKLMTEIEDLIRRRIPVVTSPA